MFVPLHTPQNTSRSTKTKVLLGYLATDLWSGQGVVSGLLVECLRN